MVPGDLRIMRRREAAIIDALADRLVEIADEAALVGEPGEQAETALGDAERHVDARRVAPFGDDEPAMEDEPVRRAARRHLADDFVPRRRLEEPLAEDAGEIARPRRLLAFGEGGGRHQGGGVETGLARRGAAPFPAVRRRD